MTNVNNSGTPDFSKKLGQHSITIEPEVTKANLNTLITQLDAPDKNVRAEAIRKLGHSYIKEATLALIEKLRRGDREPSIRTQLAKAVIRGFDGKEEAIEVLGKTLLNDKDISVCVAAAESLGKIGNYNMPVALEILNRAKLLHQNDRGVSDTIDKAIEQIKATEKKLKAAPNPFPIPKFDSGARSTAIFPCATDQASLSSAANMARYMSTTDNYESPPQTDLSAQFEDLETERIRTTEEQLERENWEAERMLEDIKHWQDHSHDYGASHHDYGADHHDDGAGHHDDGLDHH